MVNNTRKIFIICILSVVAIVSACAQRFRSETYRSYINTHSSEAINQMRKYQIPASITMAQALIESGAGLSTLSSAFNNHFGIKCHSSWQGKKTYKSDDYHNECFRVYDNWRQSYEDHSTFLKQRRYKSLFDLDISDYVGWARGLQRCGYATNKGYANMLIAVIEECELYLLDKNIIPSWVSSAPYANRGNMSRPSNRSVNNRAVRTGQDRLSRPTYISYGLLYVIAKNGDTYSSIADDMDMDASDIALYNDAPEDFPLKKGDIVYLQSKNSRATPKYPIYEVRVGDSMHSISQLFGIKLGALYDLNNKGADYVPQEGDILRLR